MGKILTPKQHRAVKKLVERECSNYYRGSCILINGGIGRCPQLDNKELCCEVRHATLYVKESFFNEAVLPLNENLYAELMQSTNSMKQCERCRQSFTASSNRQKYCKDCAAIEQKIKDAARKRKYRGKAS